MRTNRVIEILDSETSDITRIQVPDRYSLKLSRQDDRYTELSQEYFD